ncbi:MAG: integrase core domain-containing protein [Phycisphaerales bacterium]
MESIYGKRREALSIGKIFRTLTEANLLIERSSDDYNLIRSHCRLGYRPPALEAICGGGQTCRTTCRRVIANGEM